MATPLSSGRTAASVLSESITITGRVAGDGDLEVRGHLEGEIDVKGDLTLAQGATVRANVTATRVVVRGALVGDTRAADSIALEPTARVVGDLTAPHITIALGAQVRGNLDMGDEARPASSSARSAAKTSSVPARPAAPATTLKAPASKPMAQKGPITPAKPVAVTRKAPVEEPAEPAKKEPPAPVVPAIKKGQKAQPKRKQGDGK